MSSGKLAAGGTCGPVNSRMASFKIARTRLQLCGVLARRRFVLPDAVDAAAHVTEIEGSPHAEMTAVKAAACRTHTGALSTTRCGNANEPLHTTRAESVVVTVDVAVDVAVDDAVEVTVVLSVDVAVVVTVVVTVVDGDVTEQSMNDPLM